ncbi:hypothetical protein C8E03_11373 [Lachnotalea glycerini]|uniref:DUF2087 domain-containing protein n=2 Tax=Lachnotalea glycerini TaxID=1763509 RepID=A0A318EHY8_9FIRM|nr:hypothetical protein C8E03_11373 [Lachnotalea glycerini]
MIQNYLDKDNKIFILPKKKNKRMQVYEYLIDKFEQDRIYTEKEVNIIINDNHSFNDLCLIRRELVDYKLFSRLDNGTCYKRT